MRVVHNYYSQLEDMASLFIRILRQLIITQVLVFLYHFVRMQSKFFFQVKLFFAVSIYNYKRLKHMYVKDFSRLASLYFLPHIFHKFNNHE